MKTCLLVDDSKAIRAIVRPIIANLGFSVVEAADGAEALKVCQAKFPTAVLLDWNMPVMNGLEFLKALRATPGGDAPIVIFCTTKDRPEQIEEGLRFGANEYIMKPFDQDILRGKFAQVGLV
jgi:two-component system, chemotaxis family, chemotaxis protein CheY